MSDEHNAERTNDLVSSSVQLLFFTYPLATNPTVGDGPGSLGGDARAAGEGKSYYLQDSQEL